MVFVSVVFGGRCGEVADGVDERKEKASVRQGDGVESLGRKTLEVDSFTFSW